MVQESHEDSNREVGEMDRNQADRLVQAHFAFEATDDVDGVLSTMSADATHHVLGSPWGEITGKAVLREFYEALFAAVRGTHVEPVGRWYGEDFVVDDALWTGRIDDATAFGLAGRSGDATFRLLHVFDLVDGLIRHERVWADTVTLDRQLS